MFIQLSHFVEAARKSPAEEISVYGQEFVTDTARFAWLKPAVHGQRGEWSGTTWTIPKGERGGAHQV